MRGIRLLAAVACGWLFVAGAVVASPPKSLSVVAHRGLLLHAPENTLANFASCLELRLGFELDVRRSRDGQLVCIHDDTVDRTTNGRGRVADLTVAELQQLDAGAWFDSAFSGERVPTIDAVFALIGAHPESPGVVAVDLKANDANVERDTIRLAEKHKILDRLLFIGRSIDQPEVRKRLRAASARSHVAALANTADELNTAVADGNSDWVYVRFVPTPQQVAQAVAAGKRTMLSGPLVAGREPERWTAAARAGVNAILTDYALECRVATR